MELALHVGTQGWWHRVSSAGSTILGQSQGAVFPAISKIPSLNQYLEKLLVLALSSPLG